MAVVINGTTGIDFSTPLSVTEGGTGLSASGSSGNFLVSTGNGWESRTISVLVNSDIGTTVQPYDATTLKSSAIGNTIQPYDVDLTAWANKTAPTGAAVGTTDTQTLTNKTLTNPTVTNYTESVVTLGIVSTAATLNITTGTIITATLTASVACTFTLPTPSAGKSFVLFLKQAATTGGGTAIFTGVKWSTSAAPIITPTAGKMDIISFMSDGTNWYGSISQGYTP